ncbi:MAG: isoprenylcysteine carboxylmethyltransferase family protein [bacterium]|nr:isoprenylcysteine carboxylmethyltransferase family protein [bacterium]
MNLIHQYFTQLYIGFIVISIIYRIRRLLKSYEVEPHEGKVYAGLTYPILLALYLIIAVGAILEYFYCRYIISTRVRVNLILSGIGLLMYVSVIPVRAKAVVALGKYMSPDIKIMEDHKLIKSGPYGYMRHPLSFCVTIETIGLTIIPNAYYSLIATLFIFIPFVIYRAYLEEKAMIEKFGDEYLNYKKEVYAFLPLKRISRKGS